jgi:hypothetical protein
LEILLPVLPDIDETSEDYTPFRTEEKSIDENGYETGDLR